MTVKIESQEKSKVVMEITVDADKISAAYNRAAKKISSQVNIPGFRKGKAPKHIIKMYVGKERLDDEVFDQVVRPALAEAYQETGIFPVSTPRVDVVQLEDGKEFIFKATVEVKPEVELGQYTGLNIEKKAAEVSEEQIEQELTRRQNLHAELVPVEDGEVCEQDIVNIDFEGFKDGEPFEGGKAEGHDLTIGSGSFIPGFEEQLIGAKPGQELEINVRFPDDYHSEDLAGKDAMFKVKINSIKRKKLLPLDDEFAKDVSEFDTLEELKEDIRQKMLEAEETRLANELRNEVLRRVVDNASVELPEGMVEERIEYMIQDFERNLLYQGIPKEQIQKYIDNNKIELHENYRIQATEAIKTELVLEKIAKEENITVTDEEVDQEIEKLAQQYGRLPEDLKAALNASGELELFKIGLVNDRTVDFLVEKNVVEQKETETAAENVEDTKKDENTEKVENTVTGE